MPLCSWRASIPLDDTQQHAAAPLLLLEQRVGAQLLAHGHDLGPVLQREVHVLLALDVVCGDEHGSRDGGGSYLRGLCWQVCAEPGLGGVGVVVQLCGVGEGL